MEFAKYAIFSVLLASVLSCAQVSCDDKDPTMTKKEPEICDGDKDEESSCGCGGGATNRVHSKTDDKEEATVEVMSTKLKRKRRKWTWKPRTQEAPSTLLLLMPKATTLVHIKWLK